jgi:hypothetical protein
MVRWPAPTMPTANLVQLSPVLHAGKIGAAHFDIPNICSCSVVGGRYVGIASHPAAHEGAIRCVLLGPALAALAHQRLVLPLRGTCIRKGHDAIAFIGAPGAGKTALAVGLARQGWQFQSDGLALIDVAAEEPCVRFSYSGALIWKHTLLALGIEPPQELERAHPRLARYFLPPDQPAAESSASVRLKAMYIVRYGASEGVPEAIGLERGAAEKHILSQVVLEQLSHFFDSVEFVREAVRKIATRVPCLSLSRNRYGDLPAQLEPIGKLLCRDPG